MFLRLLNITLRLGSLGLKLLLTLYMAKYLGLAEMGTYGLVTAAVSIFIPLLGLRLDYVVSRELVDVSKVDIAAKMRDQGVFYGLNYVGFILLALLYLLLPHDGISTQILIFTLALSILESFAAITAGNFIPLGRPILSNVLFFIRSALWVIPAILLGYYFPEFRNAETIFGLWLGGIVVSLLFTCLVWKDLPWLALKAIKIDWSWIRSSVRKTFPIWLGAVAGAGAGSLDRFVVESELGREFVGIVSFYGSFTVAITALLTSGIFAFSYPHLIRLHNNRQPHAFYKEVRKTTLEALVCAGGFALILGYGIPFLGHHLDQPSFYENKVTFWLLLLAVWLKSGSESLYYVLYAWGQDKSIWMCNLATLGVALICNITLVPLFGLVGIGYSSVMAAVFVGVWRLYYVRKYKFSYQEAA